LASFTDELVDRWHETLWLVSSDTSCFGWKRSPLESLSREAGMTAR
jgi:hypothetical protein